MNLGEKYATTVEQVVNANPKNSELLLQILLGEEFANQALMILNMKEKQTSEDGMYHNSIFGMPIDTTISSDDPSYLSERPSFAVFEIGCTNSVQHFADYWENLGYDSYTDYLYGVLNNPGKGIDIYKKMTGNAVNRQDEEDIEHNILFGHIVRLLFPDSVQIAVVWIQKSSDGISAFPAEFASEERDSLMRAFEISKEEINEEQVENLILGIGRTVEERGAFSKVQGKIAFSVSGYNDDPRELDEIPEVRAYFHKLDELMPFFLFYIASENNEPMVRLFLGMFIDRKLFSDPAPSEEVMQEFKHFLHTRLNAVADYCSKCSEVDKREVDPVETVYHTYRSCGYSIDREMAKEILKAR